jgi:hypothetical protein
MCGLSRYFAPPPGQSSLRKRLGTGDDVGLRTDAAGDEGPHPFLRTLGMKHKPERQCLGLTLNIDLHAGPLTERMTVVVKVRKACPHVRGEFVSEVDASVAE